MKDWRNVAKGFLHNQSDSLIYKKAYHSSSSYYIRFSWAGYLKNLMFLIWKFFPDLLTSWVNISQPNELFVVFCNTYWTFSLFFSYFCQISLRFWHIACIWWTMRNGVFLALSRIHCKMIPLFQQGRGPTRKMHFHSHLFIHFL